MQEEKQRPERSLSVAWSQRAQHERAKKVRSLAGVGVRKSPRMSVKESHPDEEALGPTVLSVSDSQ